MVGDYLSGASYTVLQSNMRVCWKYLNCKTISMTYWCQCYQPESKLDLSGILGDYLSGASYSALPSNIRQCCKCFNCRNIFMTY